MTTQPTTTGDVVLVHTSDLHVEDGLPDGWPLSRPPLHLETTIPGIFAVGDVRCGSAKRVAAAVGEGSVCVQLIHRILSE